MPLKRYLSFFGHEYHPLQGMEDFVGDHDTIEQAIEAVEKALREDPWPGQTSDPWDNRWGIVWDSESRADVWESPYTPPGEAPKNA